MIYLDSSNIILPNLLDTDSSSYVLVFKNNVTNEKFALDASNISDNDLYFKFNIDASAMANDEYTVALYDSSLQCIGTYLAQKGINKVHKTSFNNDTEYIVFEG